ncbi:MAG: tRNA (cytidine(34)-2'-O)-methyltransferase [Pirellulaceae bacterium]
MSDSTSKNFPLHVVLYQPEIPPNTGNIGRTCVALGAKLWIVRPMGFRLDSSQIKRSGLDYWDDLALEVVDHWEQIEERLPSNKIWLLTKYGDKSHCSVKYETGDVLVFGNESAGLPEAIHARYAHRQLVIPMPGPVRCLNLATSAGIVMYEASRQIGLIS